MNLYNLKTKLENLNLETLQSCQNKNAALSTPHQPARQLRFTELCRELSIMDSANRPEV